MIYNSGSNESTTFQENLNSYPEEFKERLIIGELDKHFYTEISLHSLSEEAKRYIIGLKDPSPESFYLKVSGIEMNYLWLLVWMLLYPIVLLVISGIYSTCEMANLYTFLTAIAPTSVGPIIFHKIWKYHSSHLKCSIIATPHYLIHVDCDKMKFFPIWKVPLNKITHYYKFVIYNYTIINIGIYADLKTKFKKESEEFADRFIILQARAKDALKRFDPSYFRNLDVLSHQIPELKTPLNISSISKYIAKCLIIVGIPIAISIGLPIALLAYLKKRI